MTDSGFIRAHGNYKELLSYKKALVIYDATVLFCNKFMDKKDRTIDQMIQAARSGKQNIVEGCMASGTSKETEIKLINVSRASLEELLEDYRDYLRTRNHVIWEKDSIESLYVRKLAYRSNESYETYREFFETRSPETVANIIVCLVNQCNYLLDRQIKKLEQDFVKDGGLRERMFNARLNFRNKN